MAELRLARLPERAPVKLTISLAPELSQALADYSAAYAEAYGREEPLAELVPAMLAQFIESDRSFARWRNTRRADAIVGAEPRS